MMFSASFASMFLFESPKYLYINGRFDESRKTLMFIAWFNGLSKKEIETRFNFMYDTEWVSWQLTAANEGAMDQNARQVSELVNTQMS
jgi:hypothetical protein